MSYLNRLSQNVVVDTANSFSGTIVAGTTWNTAGTGTSTSGYSAVQVMVKSDKNATVFIDQGRTDSSFQVTDTYDYNVLTDNFSVTTAITAPFVRVRVTNVDVTDSTTTVDTQLVPIISSLPRSLDRRGRFMTTVGGLYDVWGMPLKISPVGWAGVHQPYRLVGTTFASTIDTNFWTATNNGTGSASGVANSKATVSSGTINNAWGQIQTVRSGRFIFSNPHKYRSLMRMTNLSQANTVRQWGAYTTTVGGAGTPPTPVDGHYFELSATNVLSLNCINAGGTPTSVSSGSFNGEVSSVTFDTNMHQYEIIFYLAGVFFYYDNILLHTHIPTTALLSSTETLPVTATAVKSANQADNATMEMWSGTILRLGRDVTSTRGVLQTGAVTAAVLKNGPGRLRTVINGDNVGSVIFYDALTATNPILSLDLTRTIGSIPCELDFFAGLTYTTTGTPKLTIVYE